MASNWIKARQTRYAAYAATYILIILAILVVANFLANRYNKSYDSTANKRFSLSDQTKKLADGLKQDMTITYFDQTQGFQAARDLLDRYSNLSPKIHVRYIDVMKSPQQVREYGVKNTGTTIVEIGNKREEAKSMTEEGVTGAMVRVIKGGVRTVCTIEGNGEHQLDDSGDNGFSSLKETLQRDNYASKSINLLEKAEVPSECTVVVVGGPQTDYAAPAVKALQTYVENGGRALVLMDPPLKVRRMSVTDNDALAGVLESWGVTPEKDLILDENPIGQLAGLGPQVPLVTTYESHPIVAPMKGLATGFPLSRSLTVKNGAKTTVEKLFSSSAGSFSTSNLGPGEIALDPKTAKKGPFTMAAAGTYSSGKPNTQGRFVVVGSSGWAANSFLRFNGNRDLLLNMMNWLSSDEDLISIRPKEPEDRRLTLTRAQMGTIRMVSQFLLPLLVIAMGIVVWWKRR
ncbi:MAG TPA: GldG family protein [Bryobacteraceae bacterium]|nr:GldG family protein [Bryobacteraceae bacterium]